MVLVKACRKVGRIEFMPKMMVTPKTTASVVKTVRSLRPHR